MKRHVVATLVAVLFGNTAATCGGSPLLPTTPAPAPAANGCPVSQPVTDRPPDDPHASSFSGPGGTWYANAERTVWAAWWGKTYTGAYKVLWVRPLGTRFQITGRRLDHEAPPLSASIPEGYQNSYEYTYLTSGIEFPVPGCWQVDGTTGAARLTFIVSIP